MMRTSAIETFRRRLRGDDRLVGLSITYTDPLVSDTIGGGADFLWIDLEHCSMSMEALNGHLLAARANGVPALVRVGAGATDLIKAVLDAGADGVIVPQVRSVREVEQIVADCRYPPFGTRGYGPRVPSNYGRNGGPSYVEAANENVFVAVQIETEPALRSIDEIVGVEGLDSVVIGPADLSGALGCLGELDNQRVTDAIVTIVETARRKGIFVGAGMGPDPEYAVLLSQLGVQWLQVGGDFSYLVKIVDKEIGELRERLSSDAGFNFGQGSIRRVEG